MDVENLAKELILKNMTPEQQMAVLDSVRSSVAQAKEVQKRKIGENVDLVVQALKKIESDIRSRYDDVGNAIEKRVASIKDGRDGADGRDGRDGKDGKNGRDGAKGDKGERGQDGRDGINGVDGVSVTNARIDFDGSLVITLSTGVELNVGEVVAPDLAESIKVISNGGGTSQYVLDTLSSLQTQITNLIPSQTGNSGKYLTTNGSALSWASIAGGGLSYQGTWNASTNTPTLTSGSGTSNYYYIVSVAGSTNLDGITDWKVGDWLLFNGTVWQKIDQSELLQSVTSADASVTVTTTGSTADLAVYTSPRVISQVRNETGATLTKGTVVYISGASGNKATVSKAICTSDSTSAQTFGLIFADIANNNNGYAILSGDLAGLNTSAIAAGTQLYLSATTAGEYTTTKQYAPNHLVYIGVVTRSHVNQGSIEVRIQNGYEMDELHNVSAQNPTNGQTLIYNESTSLWEKHTLTAGTGISVSNGAGSISLALASGYGDTQNPYASKTANYVLAAPNGSAGVPTFRAIVAADIPTLNQNTTGNAGTVTNGAYVNVANTFSANQIISITDNTNAALRVTQLGTGNALLIEDSANPDATPFVVDASGNAVVGYTASTTTISGSGTITPHLQVHGTTSSTASIGDFGWSNAIPYYTFNKSGGAIGVYTAPTATTPLGSIYFNGADGSTFKNAVEIRGASDSGISAGIVPGRLTIHTTDTAGSTSERIRINSIGMGIGTTDTTYPLLVSDGAETLVFAPNSTVSNFGAQGSALAFLTNNIEAMRLSLNGDLGIGTTSPKTHFEVSGTNNLEWQVTASISGTTMTVTAVTSGTIAVGDLVYNSLIQPYTRVTALGTGTGGVGTYTVSVSQTVASATTLGTSQYGATLARITDTDGAVSAGQPTGGLQFYTSDTSSPTAGVGAYVVGIAESTTPDTALVFGTRDNTGGGVDANERVRIDSVGVLLVGYSSATATVAAATAITPRFQIHGSTLSPASVGQYAWSGTNAYYTFNSSAGAIGTYTAVASGDTLGVIQFNGTDNTSFVGAAQIRSSAEGTISTGIVPARLQFYTASSAGTLTERMRIDSAGYVGIANTAAACALDVTGGIQTSRTTVTSPATTDGNIFSGSYTPTFTNTTNISSSTPVTCYYTRVGNVVSVFGRVDVTATATGNTVLGVSLPIASNLTTNAQLSGTVATTSATVANNVSGRINGDTTNDRATVQWNAVLTTAVTYSINFSYVIV